MDSYLGLRVRSHHGGLSIYAGGRLQGTGNLLGVFFSHPFGPFPSFHFPSLPPLLSSLSSCREVASQKNQPAVDLGNAVGFLVVVNNNYSHQTRPELCIYRIRVGEHDGDVIFKSGSGNMAVSCMRNASGDNYRNSSFIVDLAMGRITTLHRTYF